MSLLPRLRLNQGDPSETRIYYCAHFVARELGYFEAAGVAVEFAWAASGGGGALGGQLPAVIDGSADLAIGGPMLLMRMVEEGGPPLAAFCAAVARNPWVLAARARQRGFSLARLAGHRVRDIARISTATLTFQWLLQQHGVANVQLEPGSGDEAADIAAVAAGEGLGLHSLHALGPAVAEGRLAVVAGLAGPTGLVPWSAYIARPERLAAEPAAFDAFARAIGRALAWTHTHSATEIAALVGRHYPHYPQAALRQVIARCQASGIFATDPLISQTAFDHFARILTAAGWLRAPVPYDSVVVTRHALAAHPRGPQWTR